MTRLSEVYGRDGGWPAVARAALLFVASLVAAVGFVVTAASLIAGLGVGTAAAIEVAALLGGAVLLATFLARPVCAPGGPRALAGVGVVAGGAGLGLFWIALPATWAGDLAGLPPVALGTYAVGLIAAFGAWISATGDDRARADAADSALGADGDAIGSVDAAIGAGATAEGIDGPDRAGAGEPDRVGADETGSSTDAGVRDAALSRDGPSSGVGSDSASPSATAAVGDGGESDDDDLEFFDDDES